MDGNAWEEYCQRLLRIRYQDYQKVPARFGGDFGIEGFTPSGVVFQCYCPDDDPCGKELYDKQRDKITKDIGKLVKNADKILSLGAGVICEWHFLTPNYDNHALLSHCRSKESLVRSKSLSAIHNDFKISLKIEDDYIRERQTCLGTDALRVQPLGEEPPQAELDKLLTSDNEIVLNIKAKLAKLELVSDKRTSLTRGLVSGYIVGRGELEILNEKFPSTYESVVQLQSAVERQLEIRMLAGSDRHGKILHDILIDYEQKLSSSFGSSLSSALIARLSTEAISDWLGRCPLDFPD
jgi:hypothetical protein